MNFWLARNVQRYYISINPYLSSSKKFYPILHLERWDGPTLNIIQSVGQSLIFDDSIVYNYIYVTHESDCVGKLLTVG